MLPIAVIAPSYFMVASSGSLSIARLDLATSFRPFDLAAEYENPALLAWAAMRHRTPLERFAMARFRRARQWRFIADC